MKKTPFYSILLSALFSLSAFTACQKAPTPDKNFDEINLSLEHVPTPLPIFPDKEDCAMPDAPQISENNDTTPQPNVWDVSAVDISKIDPARKLIAFTFDDTPARYLENMIAIYADFNENNPDCIASATLFVNGCLFDAQSPTLLATALALGFELGNHTYSHTNLATLSLAETTDEIDRVDNLLFHIDGKRRHLLRPPFGTISAKQKELSQVPIINWSIDTRDWTGISAEKIYQSVMQNKFPGAIVLLHDGHENTLQALKRLLPDLKTDGYQIVSVSQMSKMHHCRLYNGKEYIRARKQK